MSKSVLRPIELQQLAGLIEDVLAKGGTFTLAPSGQSMLPMLREGQDTVRLCAPSQHSPKKYDVILYRRDNGQYVLHRIIGQDAAGYILCGDGQYIPEKGIRSEQIVGVLCGFTRGSLRETGNRRQTEREISVDCLRYRCYAVVWTFLRPVRGLVFRTRRKLLKK